MKKTNNYYHVESNTIISGPHSLRSKDIRSLTRCGNPEALPTEKLTEANLYPEYLEDGEALVGYNSPVWETETQRVVKYIKPLPANYAEMQLQQKRDTMSITRLQARLVLLQSPHPEHDNLWNAVQLWAQTQSEETKAFFEDAQNWDRNNPYISAGAQVLGLTEEQLDSLFETGSTI